LRRVLAVLVLFATLTWVVTSSPARADAQQASLHQRSAVASPTIIASGGQFANVRGLAVDAAGNLYISLAANPAPAHCVSRQVSAVSNTSPLSAPNAKITVTVFSDCASAPGEDPSGIAVTPQGRVFLANRLQNRIRLLDMTTGQVAVVPVSAAKNVAHSNTSNLDLFQPAGLAIDESQNLYVADRGNHRVLALAPGAVDFSYIAHIVDATAVATDDSRGRLYVASPASNRVFIIDLASGNTNAFAGTGAPSNPASAQLAAPISAASAAIASPEGVAVDGVGNVFIADTGANALLRVDAKSGMLARVALASTLNSPAALAMDRRGNLFVADLGNHRVIELPGIGAAAPTAAVTISPAQFDFGAEPTGGTTPAQLFTLTNNSANAFSLKTTDITFTGANFADFTQTNNCVPQVAAGASCQINVTFAPQATGSRAAVLQVTDADPSSPQTAQLSGTGDDFQVTASSSAATSQNVVPGNSATYNLQITPDATFSGTVTPACPLQLPNNSLTCVIKPSTVNVTAGQSAPFTVTMGTQGTTVTPATVPALRDFPDGPARPLLFAALVAMFFLLISRMYLRSPRAQMFAWNSPRRRVLALFSFALVAMCAAVALAGCGSSSTTNPNETPPGIYSIDISATAQNASRAITLTLNVD